MLFSVIFDFNIMQCVNLVFYFYFGLLIICRINFKEDLLILTSKYFVDFDGPFWKYNVFLLELVFRKLSRNSTPSNGAFGMITMWSVGCPFRSGWFANMVISFAFVIIKGPNLIKIISPRNQDIIMVYEAVIKVDIYHVGLANTRAQL